MSSKLTRQYVLAKHVPAQRVLHRDKVKTRNLAFFPNYVKIPAGRLLSLIDCLINHGTKEKDTKALHYRRPSATRIHFVLTRDPPVKLFLKTELSLQCDCTDPFRTATPGL